MGGGLLFALIDASVDNSRTKDAEVLLKPIRDSLIDYDFAQILADEIGAQIKTIDWLHAQDLVLERSIDKERYMKRFKESDASAVLFMTANYKLSTNFDSVITDVQLIMFPNEKACMKFKEKANEDDDPVNRDNNIYRNHLWVSVALDTTGTKEENVELLSESNAVKVREALAASAKQMAEKIVDDVMTEKEAKEKS